MIDFISGKSEMPDFLAWVFLILTFFWIVANGLDGAYYTQLSPPKDDPIGAYNHGF